MITNFTKNKDSFVRAYSYNPMLSTLTLVLGKDNIAYQYIGVPQIVVNSFVSNEHKGRYFSRNIKPIYPSRKLTSSEYRYTEDN